MSLAELIPTVRTLSMSDKLRLIQWIAGDLAGIKDNDSNSAEPIAGVVEEAREDERVQAAVHAIGLRNGLGCLEELAPQGVVEETPDNGEKVESPIKASLTYPYWSPDHESEAAAILTRMLEAEKSAS